MRLNAKWCCRYRIVPTGDMRRADDLNIFDELKNKLIYVVDKKPFQRILNVPSKLIRFLGKPDKKQPDDTILKNGARQISYVNQTRAAKTDIFIYIN